MVATYCAGGRESQDCAELFAWEFAAILAGEQELAMELHVAAVHSQGKKSRNTREAREDRDPPDPSQPAGLRDHG